MEPLPVQTSSFFCRETIPNRESPKAHKICIQRTVFYPEDDLISRKRSKSIFKKKKLWPKLLQRICSRLRRLALVSITLQHLYFDRLIETFFNSYYLHVCEQVMVISRHNKLPWQRHDLLKTPLILPLSGYNSKTSSVTPMFYYGTIISVLRYIFCAKIEKLYPRGSEPP